jgi:phosphate starvation-inducible protein PhoH
LAKLTADDIVRHRLVTDIVNAYDGNGENSDKDGAGEKANKQ